MKMTWRKFHSCRDAQSRGARSKNSPGAVQALRPDAVGGRYPVARHRRALQVLYRDDWQMEFTLPLHGIRLYTGVLAPVKLFLS